MISRILLVYTSLFLYSIYVTMCIIIITITVYYQIVIAAHVTGVCTLLECGLACSLLLLKWLVLILQVRFG